MLYLVTDAFQKFKHVHDHLVNIITNYRKKNLTSNWVMKDVTGLYGTEFFLFFSLSTGGLNGIAGRAVNNARRFPGKYCVIFYFFSKKKTIKYKKGNCEL